MLEQSTHLERALWAAIRAMKERSNMLGRMARQEKEKGRSKSGEDFEREMNISKGHAQALRVLLLKGTATAPGEKKELRKGEEEAA